MKYKVKDLIQAAKEGEVDVIAHQCNCFNTMKSGIAPQIAKAFPVTVAADNTTKRGDKNKLGVCSYSIYRREDNSYLTIFNLYGQYDWRGRNNTDYFALRSSLNMMARLLQVEEGYLTIGLPKLGAGLGGGDWSIISKIIEEELDGFDVTIYVLNEEEIPSD